MIVKTSWKRITVRIRLKYVENLWIEESSLPAELVEEKEEIKKTWYHCVKYQKVTVFNFRTEKWTLLKK